jgi:hypothetical protein
MRGEVEESVALRVRTFQAFELNTALRAEFFPMKTELAT